MFTLSNANWRISLLGDEIQQKRNYWSRSCGNYSLPGFSPVQTRVCPANLLVGDSETGPFAGA